MMNIRSNLLILPCDNIFTYDLQCLLDFYRSLKNGDVVGTYELSDINALKQRAVVGINESNKIIYYRNRPEQPLSNYILLLHVLLGKKSLKSLSAFLKGQHEREYLRDFIGSRVPFGVHGFDIGREWIDIGTPDELEGANKLAWITKLL